MFGIGNAPARPSIGLPVARPVSTFTALRTAATCADDVSPPAARCTIATCASRGAPKSLVAVTSACTAGALDGTRLASALDWLSWGK